jgi:hypothetical protein
MVSQWHILFKNGKTLGDFKGSVFLRSDYLSNGFSPTNLKNAGFTPSNLKNAGYLSLKLYPPGIPLQI